MPADRNHPGADGNLDAPRQPGHTDRMSTVVAVSTSQRKTGLGRIIITHRA